eukprot:gene8722-biopygen15185
MARACPVTPSLSFGGSGKKVVLCKDTPEPHQEKLERGGRARTRDAIFLRGRGGAAGPACPLSVSVRTPFRALSKRWKRRCNAPALRFPTSVLRFHLRRFAHPSGGHLAAWGPGPGGLGRPRWPAKNHEIHLIRHGQTKKVASRIW